MNVSKVEDFVPADNLQLIGVHSLQSCWPHMHNATIAHRMRLKFIASGTQSEQCVSMHYVITNLLYQDAKVASKLCMGGPVKYTAHEGANVTNAWLLQYVVPHIAQHFSEQFAITLAFPILWACYNSQCSIPIPPTSKNIIWAAYEMGWPNNLPAQQNPVEKSSLSL